MARPAIDLTQLSVDEKLDLIDELWSSLAPEDMSIGPELRQELDRRLDRLDRDGPNGRHWEDVRAEMTSRKP